MGTLCICKRYYQDRGGDLVVSVLIISDNRCSNPAVIKGFSMKMLFEKNKNDHKEAGVSQFHKATTYY